MAPQPLFLDQRPDTGPICGWLNRSETGEAVEEHLARCIARHDGKAALEPGSRVLPGAAAIGNERLGKGVAQLQTLARDLTLAAEQLKDALWIGLADNQHRIDLSRLHRIGRKPIGRFA